MDKSSKQRVYVALGVVAILVVVWAAVYWGRGGSPSVPELPAAPGLAGPSMDRATVENALTLWMAGEKDKAMEAALNGETQPGTVTAVSPAVKRAFATSESDLKDMSQEELAANKKEWAAMAVGLQDLAKALLEKSRQAAASGDATGAKTIREKVRDLGRELARPESLLVFQMVGRNILNRAEKP